MNRGRRVLLCAASKPLCAPCPDGPPLNVSVIVSTYNQPAWLELTLWGYAHQTRRPEEVLVADDGSGPDTAEVIRRVSQESGLAVRHVWHEDDGFRKTEALNRALREAIGDYLIFTDGDCVPRSDLVAVHAAAARQARFLSGGAVRLSMPVSHEITRDDVAAGRCFDHNWLASRWDGEGRQPSPRLLKLRVRGAAAAWLNRLTPTRPTWNGGNASCWRADALAVRGFDERMKYGGEDREFGERLVRRGVRPRHVRYTAVCVHLEHERGYVRPEHRERNDAIRRESRRLRRTATPCGLDKAT